MSVTCRSAMLREVCRSLLFSVALCFCVVWLRAVTFPRTVVIAFRKTLENYSKTNHSQSCTNILVCHLFFFLLLASTVHNFYIQLLRYQDCISMSSNFVMTFDSEWYLKINICLRTVKMLHAPDLLLGLHSSKNNAFFYCTLCHNCMFYCRWSFFNVFL